MNGWEPQHHGYWGEGAQWSGGKEVGTCNQSILPAWPPRTLGALKCLPPPPPGGSLIEHPGRLFCFFVDDKYNGGIAAVIQEEDHMVLNGPLHQISAYKCTIER